MTKPALLELALVYSVVPLGFSQKHFQDNCAYLTYFVLIRWKILEDQAGPSIHIWLIRIQLRLAIFYDNYFSNLWLCFMYPLVASLPWICFAVAMANGLHQKIGYYSLHWRHFSSILRCLTCPKVEILFPCNIFESFVHVFENKRCLKFKPFLSEVGWSVGDHYHSNTQASYLTKIFPCMWRGILTQTM